MRNTIWNGTKAAVLSLALALGSLALLATPDRAQADDRLRGVTIDRAGVHFNFGPGYHYLHVDYPKARRHFERNEHYRKAKAFERERDRLLERFDKAIDDGSWQRAEKSFHKAWRVEERRQLQLAKLERDRERFARKHVKKHHYRYSWRRHSRR